MTQQSYFTILKPKKKKTKEEKENTNTPETKLEHIRILLNGKVTSNETFVSMEKDSENETPEKTKNERIQLLWNVPTSKESSQLFTTRGFVQQQKENEYAGFVNYQGIQIPIHLMYIDEYDSMEIIFGMKSQAKLNRYIRFEPGVDTEPRHVEYSY